MLNKCYRKHFHFLKVTGNCAFCSHTWSVNSTPILKQIRFVTSFALPIKLLMCCRLKWILGQIISPSLISIVLFLHGSHYHKKRQVKKWEESNKVEIIWPAIHFNGPLFAKFKQKFVAFFRTLPLPRHFPTLTPNFCDSFVLPFINRDIKIGFYLLQPLLCSNLRFYCAAAVDNRTRLDFHGKPCIWDGPTIKRNIKGNSVLYVLKNEVMTLWSL